VQGRRGFREVQGADGGSSSKGARIIPGSAPADCIGFDPRWQVSGVTQSGRIACMQAALILDTHPLPAAGSAAALDNTSNTNAQPIQGGLSPRSDDVPVLRSTDGVFPSWVATKSAVQGMLREAGVLSAVPVETAQAGSGHNGTSEPPPKVARGRRSAPSDDAAYADGGASSASAASASAAPSAGAGALSTQSDIEDRLRQMRAMVHER